MARTRKTQREKLIERLSTGENLTVSEARNRLGIDHLAKRIYDLRTEDFLRIFTNKVKVKGGPNRGKKVTAYRMNPSEVDFLV